MNTTLGIGSGGWKEGEYKIGQSDIVNMLAIEVSLTARYRRSTAFNTYS